MGVLFIIFGAFVVGAIATGVLVCAFTPAEKDVNEAYVDECIKILTAYKEGKTIEWMFLDGVDNEWREVVLPVFNFGTAIYRIKEESKDSKKVNKYF